MNPTRIRRALVLGDLHSDSAHLRLACEAALAHSCDVIVQLGDFNYYPHLSEVHPERQFLDELDTVLDKYNLPCVFIDGNHENFDALWGTHPITDDGFYALEKCSSRLYYAPRGLRWRWAHTTCLALGGAVSTDMTARQRWENGASRTLWWPQEALTEADLIRATTSEAPVDVMFAHDAPAGITIPNARWADSPASAANRRAVQHVAARVRARRLYHGHYHYRYDTIMEHSTHRTTVHGLSCNGAQGRSWAVVDLEEPDHV